MPCWVVDRWVAQGCRHGFFGREIDCSDNVVSQALLRQVFPNVNLHLLEQCHGTDIVEVFRDEDSRSLPKADGWIVNFPAIKKPTVFGIKTADCFPVLLRVPHRELVSVLHCGWRGAAAGIISNAVKTLTAHGVSASEIEVAIGPGARSCCYEVGPEFVDMVPVSAIIERGGKLFCDIAQVIIEDAGRVGILESNICSASLCTICSTRFFSYRREKNLSGRQLSFAASNA